MSTKATLSPLNGVKVVELGGVGPLQFGGMLLADLGADVVRIDRPHETEAFTVPGHLDVLNRGKRSVCLDLRQPRVRDLVLSAVSDWDVLIEGFRPGVAERLGLGPDDCLAVNPGLVYGRMTGWGQSGPWAVRAGHDINYVATTGLLDAIGSADGPPQVPLSVVGDYGGGGTYLAIGVLASLLEANRTGLGQVVDAAIVDGVSHLLAAFHALSNANAWESRRGSNVVDGGAPFYALYETSDGRYVSLGAIERRFFEAALKVLKVDLDLDRQFDKATWPESKERLARTFCTRTLAEWVNAFEGVDACFAPVNTLLESAQDEHLHARGAVVSDAHGRLAPGPAPRFSRTATSPSAACPPPGENTREVLLEWGVDDPEELLSEGWARAAVMDGGRHA